MESGCVRHVKESQVVLTMTVAHMVLPKGQQHRLTRGKWTVVCMSPAEVP